MKKTYITPKMEIEVAEPQQFLTESTVTGAIDSKLEVDYGGVDEDGSKDPYANRFKAWDDEAWDKL